MGDRLSKESAIRETHTWDIFCRVVDHFGDAGVCWRLARQLAREHHARVRLWIDDLESLARLEPGIRPVEHQRVDEIEVCRWHEPFPQTTPAEIVIEAFGCGLPDDYVTTMAQAARRPVWVVLEYLSAEPWVSEHHGRPSPHPRLPLDRYFFFPGFVEGTGGLMREADLFERREAFDATRRNAFWRSLHFEPPSPDALTVSMFAYADAPFEEILDCWSEGDREVIVALPQATTPALSTGPQLAPGKMREPGVVRRGAVEVRTFPFLAQSRYDELLWACDCNFVRGEDSFVRAQWAACPFVWQAYRQEERAHWTKLEAFLDLYCQGLPAGPRAAAATLMRVWNQYEFPAVTVRSAWHAFAAELGTLRTHGRVWGEGLAKLGSLSGNLASFCLSKLK